jgi:hypothetical protein
VSRRSFVKIEIAFLLAIPAWGFVISCAGLYPDSFSSVYLIAYFYLVAGWAFFLSRVVPNMVVNWIALGEAGICLVGLVCGLHFFCAWLHREIARKRVLQQLGPDEILPSLGTWKLRSTLSIVGIVVLMFVAGISAVGSVHQLVWIRTRP